jgi:ALG3 protein
VSAHGRYQFYSWYCHSLPFLLWSTSLRTWQRLAVWLAVEFVCNVYPPTAASSLLLLTCHGILLLAASNPHTLQFSASVGCNILLGGSRGGTGQADEQWHLEALRQPQGHYTKMHLEWHAIHCCRGQASPAGGISTDGRSSSKCHLEHISRKLDSRVSTVSAGRCSSSTCGR